MIGCSPFPRAAAWCIGLGAIGSILIRAADPPPIVFAPALVLSTVDVPLQLASADFNGDGRKDLAVNIVGTLGVEVHLGRGDGTFDPAPPALVGVRHSDLAAADFNRDGHPDLAVSEYSPRQVSIALGNGDGTFAAGPASPTGLSPIEVHAGDFNGDGWPDLLAAGEFFGMAVFLNTGTGALGARFDVHADGAPPSFGGHVSYLVVDLDADGRDDIAVAGFENWDFECSGDGFTFWRSLGTGSFSRTDVPGSACSHSLAGADWDRDGRRDVMVLAFGGFTIYRNLGGGSFAPAAPPNPILEGEEILAADFNLDGFVDLALPWDAQMPVSAGREDGTFPPGNAIPLPGRFSDILSDDFDNDGRPDLALSVYEFAEGQVNAVAVFLNRSVTTPGAVGEAASGPAQPLQVAGYDLSSGDISVTYGPACGATDHSIVYGSLESPNRGEYLGRACGVGTSGSAVFNPGLPSVFFLIVGDDGTVEGSYGTDASGTERPESFGLGVCDRPQVLTALCP